MDRQARSTESDYYRHQHFDRDHIRQVRTYYLQFIAGSNFVVELGCGRGEFLELARGEGKRTLGVDKDPGMIAETKARDLDVVQMDAIEFLEATSEVPDAVFAAHLIEHLTVEDATRLFAAAKRCLSPGGVLVVVTPNPRCLSVILSDFWNDPTHVRPYTVPLLEFIADQVGLEPADSGVNPTDEPGAPPELRVPYTMAPWSHLEPPTLPPWSEDQLDLEPGAVKQGLHAVLQRVYDVNQALFEQIKVLDGRIDQIRHQTHVASLNINRILEHLYGPNEIFMVARKPA